MHALDLRLLSVDPLTRAVDPQRAVTGSALLRVAGQLFHLAGNGACASAAGANLQQALIALPDSTVSGKTTVAIFSAIEAANKSSEK